MPKVSVIVPVYGVEKYIERCAVSLFEQTLDGLEYIFVDDCTPDKSIEILKLAIEKYRSRFAEGKNTVRIERMKTNSGLPAVRQHGVQLATGDYIIHCDSDDWVDTDMFRLLYEKAVSENADMVFCDFNKTDGTTNDLIKEVFPADENNLTTYILTKKTNSSLCNKLIKRSVYENASIIFPRYNNLEDWTVLSQLSLFVDKYAVVPKPLYYYYHNADSITGNADVGNLIRRFNDSCGNIKLVETFFQRNSVLEKYSNEFDRIRIIEQILFVDHMDKPGIYGLWKSLSKELKHKPIFNPYLSSRDKIRYYVMYFRLYPTVKRIYDSFRNHSSLQR